MSNEVSSQYFSYQQVADDRFLDEIVRREDFKSEKEIFRGCIYEKNKVASLIYKGEHKGKPVALKIQILEPSIDEIDIINSFNKQNQSQWIRAPHLYSGNKWNKKDGYGYLLLEYIDGKMIYNPPLASESEIKKFCRFYAEYKTKATTKPLFPRSQDEQDSLQVFTIRVKRWAKMAESKKQLSQTTKKYLDRYLAIINTYLKDVQLQFMHGHLNYDDIYEVGDNQYVLMSNLFWSYRPEYYDTTFNIWAGIKSITDLNISEKDVITYVEKWLKEYKELPVIRNDPSFESKFMLMLLERCIGALLVDLAYKNYKKNRDKHFKHLSGIFQSLFEYSARNIST